MTEIKRGYQTGHFIRMKKKRREKCFTSLKNEEKTELSARKLPHPTLDKVYKTPRSEELKSLVCLAPLPGLPTRGAHPPALPDDSAVRLEINY